MSTFDAYLGSTELGDPLRGHVGGAEDEGLVDLDLESVVLGDNQSLGDAGVAAVEESKQGTSVSDYYPREKISATEAVCRGAFSFRHAACTVTRMSIDLRVAVDGSNSHDEG